MELSLLLCNPSYARHLDKLAYTFGYCLLGMGSLVVADYNRVLIDTELINTTASSYQIAGFLGV